MVCGFLRARFEFCAESRRNDSNLRASLRAVRFTRTPDQGQELIGRATTFPFLFAITNRPALSLSWLPRRLKRTLRNQWSPQRKRLSPERMALMPFLMETGLRNLPQKRLSWRTPHLQRSRRPMVVLSGRGVLRLSKQSMSRIFYDYVGSIFLLLMILF